MVNNFCGKVGRCNWTALRRVPGQDTTKHGSFCRRREKCGGKTHHVGKNEEESPVLPCFFEFKQ